MEYNNLQPVDDINKENASIHVDDSEHTTDESEENRITESENPSEPLIDDTTSIMDKVQDEALDDVIYNALEKVKGYFFNNKMDEQKLAQFMLRMLTLDDNNRNGKALKLNPQVLDEVVNEMLKIDDLNTSCSSNDVIDKLLGEETAKTICDKLTTEKVDVLLEKLLGEDTRKLICEKLESDSLDELLNKLIDEKLNFDNNTGPNHPNFDEFINKILGKDVEEFIKRKIEFLGMPVTEDELKIVEIDEIE